MKSGPRSAGVILIQNWDRPKPAVGEAEVSFLQGAFYVQVDQIPKANPRSVDLGRKSVPSLSSVYSMLPSVIALADLVIGFRRGGLHPWTQLPFLLARYKSFMPHLLPCFTPLIQDRSRYPT